MTNIIENETIEKYKDLYGIQDTYIVLRILSLKTKLLSKKKVCLSNEEVLIFLNNAMNYGLMQLWLMENNLKGIELSLDDKLNKLFELNTDEELLSLYNIEQNYNENNLDNVRKMIIDRYLNRLKG